MLGPSELHLLPPEKTNAPLPQTPALFPQMTFWTSRTWVFWLPISCIRWGAWYAGSRYRKCPLSGRMDRAGEKASVEGLPKKPRGQNRMGMGMGMGMGTESVFPGSRGSRLVKSSTGQVLHPLWAPQTSPPSPNKGPGPSSTPEGPLNSQASWKG